MSYQALYRKWRPETFDKVIGQDAVMTTLKNQISSGRIGHAYLFCGTRGTGKTSAAKIFARAVNCPHAMEHDGNPCNECSICMSIKNGSSMNVFEIDAASNNGVDNIRDIREEVEYPPVEGHYKVYIIDEVHMLSSGAFNALLKTLEEPPAYVIFILATTDPQKIPATILSRCQRYDFRRMTKRAAADHLKEIAENEGMDVEPKALSYIAEAADGSMRDALSLLDQCISYHYGGHLSYENVLEIVGAADQRVYSELYGSIVSGDIEKALRQIGGIIDSGVDIMQLISDMVWYLRNVLLAGSASDAAELLDISEDRFEMARKDAALASKKQLTSILGEFAELSNRARFAPQKRVLLEVLVIRLCLKDSVTKDIDAQVNESALNAGIAARLKTRPVRESGQHLMEEKKDAAPIPETEVSAGQGQAPAGIMSERDSEAAVGREKKNSAQGRVMDVLKENWQSMVSELLPSNRPLFAGTVLKEENGSIVLLFKNSMNFKLAAGNIEENGVLRLRELASELTGQDIKFMARVARPGEIESTRDQATDEELSRINFHIEIED